MLKSALARTQTPKSARCPLRRPGVNRPERRQKQNDAGLLLLAFFRLFLDMEDMEGFLILEKDTCLQSSKNI
jgi:hypothetical protein